MTEKNYTCQDCKYYYFDEEYCTNIFYKNFNPSTPCCDFFELGIFNKRFYVKAEPLVISTGQYYVLIDRENELRDSDGCYLSFDYEYEAELLCKFLNQRI